MSKGKVTDFFATRKRNRFNQDDVLLNKQKKTQSVIEPDPMSIEKAALIKAVEKELNARTRSRTRLAQKQEIQNVDPVGEVKAPVEDEPERKVTRSSARKQKMEELKKKMNRLDDKLEKVKEVQKPEIASVEAEVKPDAPKQQKGKKKVNKAELKAKLKTFNENLAAAQEKVEATKAADEVEKVDANTAAFNKYKDLASKDIDIKCTLTLPTSYARILDFFKGSDTIVKFLTNRQETCTFLKLKLGIQNITKHTFTQGHLGQIKTVYPDAYVIKQEKMFIDFKNDYHLTIHPNLEEIQRLNESGFKDFSPSVLLARLNSFKTNLFTIVKQLHQKFLESIGITSVEFKDIKRWHPKFDLENCPALEEAQLPKSPNESVKVKTGQDLLNIAKDVYSSRIQEAIKEHNKEATTPLDIVGAAKPLAPKVTDVSKEITTTAEVLTGSVDQQKLTQLKDKKEKNYSALLEKIRNKEKTKAFESMVINSDKEKKLMKYGLYKDSIRFLLFFFQAEKKSTLEFEKINTKMADNLKGKVQSDTETRELLLEMVNDVNLHGGNNLKWISSIRVRNITYIKMDKSFQLNDLWAKCDKLISQL